MSASSPSLTATTPSSARTTWQPCRVARSTTKSWPSRRKRSGWPRFAAPRRSSSAAKNSCSCPTARKSGYPFLIENDCFSIQFGEFNKPNFFVTYRSFALWQFGAAKLNRRFLDWAASVGFTTFQDESLSRVDFTFDYRIEAIDFDEDSFVSSATKDNQHRKNRQVQTFRFGEGEFVLRVYNKVDEIQEKSAKTWFFDLWGCEENVWRIEWQVRKEWLRTFGIRTFADLEERQGDLLRVLVNDHTTLRIKTEDSNRSRWPMHPLWIDLQERVAQMDGLGIVKELDPAALLEERETRIAISVYGYLKRIGAIQGINARHPRSASRKAAPCCAKSWIASTTI